MTEKITTIKIAKNTKLRLDNLKSNKGESYEEVIKRILSILNLLRVNPDSARAKLKALDILRD